MGLDNKELKQAKKAKDRIFFNLKEIANLREELSYEGNERKKKKIQDKIQLRKGIITDYSKELGNMGLGLDEYILELDERQKNILLEIFPYGLGSNSLESQKERDSIISQYKDWIKKLKKLRDKYPPYDPGLPVKHKLKNKIYKQEKDIGWFMLIRSNPEQKAYDPEWNYKEHFATSTEFTQEERDIIEHCIKIGEEYDKYLDERYGWIAEIGESLCGKGENIIEWGNEKQAKIWAKNLHTKVFPQIVRSMEEGENLSEEEVRAKSIEMTKGFIRFIADREELNRCLYLWNELKKDETLDVKDEDKKDFAVFLVLRKEIGEEKAWFTYGYTKIPETEEGIELLLNYSLEELGLE